MKAMPFSGGEPRDLCLVYGSARMVRDADVFMTKCVSLSDVSPLFLFRVSAGESAARQSPAEPQEGAVLVTLLGLVRHQLDDPVLPQLARLHRPWLKIVVRQRLLRPPLRR